jgi:hypothetical protein
MKTVFAILLGTLLMYGLLYLASLAYAQNVIGNQHTPAGQMEGSHQFTGSKMTAASVTWHTMNPRWLMVFDTQTMPSGTFTASTPLIVCQFIQGAGNEGDGTQNFDWSSHPIIVTTGVLVVVSVNPQGCGAMTVDGANNWIAGQMQ